jgi:trimethylamine--corrinoid protein Co-methyltransferase
MFDLEGLELKTAYYRRLTDHQCRQLHEASLEILERTGVRFYDEAAVQLLGRSGARVTDGNLVHIQPWRVEWALRAAPKLITLYDQTLKPAVRLAGRQAYYGNGSDLLYIVDHRTDTRRRALLQDLNEGLLLLDSLDGIDFVMSFVLPDDVPVEQTELVQMRAMLAYSNKSVVYVTTNLARTQAVVEMAEAAAGGTEELRDRPFATCYINITAPLRHNVESVQKLMWLAKKGLPLIYLPPTATRAVTTPLPVAGYTALNNAGQLAGLVLAQLVQEGTPFIRCAYGGQTFDMHTMVGQLAAPEARGFHSDLAHWYNLPCFGIGGTSGSKTVDQQAALEAALTLLQASLSGEGLIHDVGYLDNGLTGSLEQLVICNEIIGWVRHFLPGLEINADTLALDVIDKVGPDGQYLGEPHTARHSRDDWYPSLLDRRSHDDWAADGGLTLRSRARQRVDEILQGYAPRPIPADVVKAWDRIIERGGC